MVRGNLFLINAVYLKESPKSRILCLTHSFQTVFHNNTVFIQKLHHITYGCKSCKGKKLFQKLPFLLFFLSRLLKQCLNQLIGNHRAADLFKGVTAVRLLGINNHISRRQQEVLSFLCLFKGNLVMIRHHHRHLHALCKCNGRSCGNSVVAGEHSIDSVPPRVLDQTVIQPVSVPDPVGDHTIHLP